MILSLDNLLKDTCLPGVAELRDALRELLGEPDAAPRLIEQQRLKHRVYRLQLEAGKLVRRLVVKLLDPRIAQRNEVVARRWLPAAGLGQSGPPLLGVAAARSGQDVWHIYEDLGECTLNSGNPDPRRVEAAVELIALIHTRFAEHPLLAECRVTGGDLGIGFYTASVRDAIRCLEALRPPAVELPPHRTTLRDRLLRRLHKLLDEQPFRAQVMAECGGPETLLHGDLWRTNVMVLAGPDGVRARLIDWDRSAVGPASYDLSTFLSRFPARDRLWILERYHHAVLDRAGWCLPPARELNVLFATAEYARVANRVIWPALLVLEGEDEWAFDDLTSVEQWFEGLAPVLPENQLPLADRLPIGPSR